MELSVKTTFATKIACLLARISSLISDISGNHISQIFLWPYEKGQDTHSVTFSMPFRAKRRSFNREANLYSPDHSTYSIS